jgi:uncharacterized membrane protein YgdD (TMEM256/DUF423 family)
MKNPIIAIGALFGAVSVALGAFGAHALNPILTPYALSIFQLSAQYMIIHALIIVAVGLLHAHHPDVRLPTLAVAFSLGIVFFSGSLLLIAFTGVAAFGAIAPIGGSLLIFGWLRLAWIAFRGR